MARFWRYVDRKKAYEYFQRFWKTGRDGLSDCRTCERSYAVQMELLMGNRAAADEYAKPMEQGRMRFCPDTPHLYWLAYLEDALDRGDLKEAEKRANALYRKGNRDKSDLSYIGAILRCWAYTDPERALELFSGCGTKRRSMTSIRAPVFCSGSCPSTSRRYIWSCPMRFLSGVRTERTTRRT